MRQSEIPDTAPQWVTAWYRIKDAAVVIAGVIAMIALGFFALAIPFIAAAFVEVIFESGGQDLPLAYWHWVAIGYATMAAMVGCVIIDSAADAAIRRSEK